jgi:RNA 3'-phosphate cyclase
MGCGLDVELLRHGFYPKGGGRVRVRVSPAQLHSRDWTERGELQRTRLLSVATEDLRGARVAERQVEGAWTEFGEFTDQQWRYVESPSTGTAVFACAHYAAGVLGDSSLGKRGKPAEKVGAECARALREQMNSGACLDRHMADQIIPYMALAPEDSTVRVAAVTDHCRTNAWVTEKFLPVRFELDEPGRTITCRHQEKAP